VKGSWYTRTGVGRGKCQKETKGTEVWKVGNFLERLHFPCPDNGKNLRLEGKKSISEAIPATVVEKGGGGKRH